MQSVLPVTLFSAADERALLATRYLSAVAVTSLMWDHLLNVDREVRLVWGRPWTSMQALVTINYYGVHGAMIYFAYMMSGFGPALSHPRRCEGFVVFGGAYAMISIGLSQIILLLRVMKVWDDRRFIKVALILGFGICYGMSAAFNTLMMRQSATKILYSQKPRACYIQDKDVYMAGTWGAMLLYDVFVFMLLVVNALNRPRRYDHEIITNLKRDGAIIFLVLFGLRMIAFLQSVIGDAAETFITILIVWSLDTNLSFQLFLMSNYVEIAIRSHSQRDFLSSTAERVLIVEEIELATM